MEDLQKEASSTERHPAVVQGQEGLSGVKSVVIKRNIKKNSDEEYVITQSVRTEMVYDTSEQARNAYLDIHDAKEEAEFEEKEQDTPVTEPTKEPKEAPAASGPTASFDAEIIRQAANTYQDVAFINGDLGFFNPMEQPAEPRAGNDPRHKNDPRVTWVTRNDGTNGGGMPEHTQVGNAYPFYANAEDEAVKSEDPNHSLLQPDFPVSDMEQELRTGVRREFEHTDDAAKAVEIALDHLAEDQNYYKKLQQVMPEFGTEEKKERDVFVKPEDKEVKEYDYDKAGKETMFPGLK